MPENFITLTIDGLDSENGHVRLDEFLSQLNDFLTALNGIDRIVGQTGSPNLYYRITKASHNSPLSFTFEPVVRKRVKAPRADYVQACHSRLFRELHAIKRQEQISPEIDETLLEHLRDMVGGLGTAFKTATVSNGHERIELDQEFETGVKRLVDEEDASYGAAEGKLEAVNIHASARRFWIYPVVGAQKIRCDFLAGTQDQVRECLGHYIRVEGMKYFRPHSPFPFRIAVREFEKVPDNESIPLTQFQGIAPGATGRMNSVEFVRAIRDEWD